MNIGIVGCGLIGQKRAKALSGCRLVSCADAIEERARALAESWPGAAAVKEWRQLVERPDIDAVIVATTHDALPAICLAAAEAGKHILVEKPAARRSWEIDPVREAAERAGVVVRVGFNHRYHPALRRAKELFDSGSIGAPMLIRGRYGHGGRVGYEREWRARREVSGGGELIDQGVHLIDLSRWFLGDFVSVQGSIHTYFWQMAVEDNGFMMLRTANDTVAFLHASCTEWKNLFSMEIFGRDGKLEINGLGGSYGLERLAFYRMLPEMGPPETTIWEYPMPDKSWADEFADFVDDIQLKRVPTASLADAQAALRVVEALYQEERP